MNSVSISFLLLFSILCFLNQFNCLIEDNSTSILEKIDKSETGKAVVEVLCLIPDITVENTIRALNEIEKTMNSTMNEKKESLVKSVFECKKEVISIKRQFIDFKLRAENSKEAYKNQRKLLNITKFGLLRHTQDLKTIEIVNDYRERSVKSTTEFLGKKIKKLKKVIRLLNSLWPKLRNNTDLNMLEYETTKKIRKSEFEVQALQFTKGIGKEETIDIKKLPIPKLMDRLLNITSDLEFFQPIIKNTISIISSNITILANSELKLKVLKILKMTKTELKRMRNNIKKELEKLTRDDELLVVSLTESKKNLMTLIDNIKEDLLEEEFKERALKSHVLQMKNFTSISHQIAEARANECNSLYKEQILLQRQYLGLLDDIVSLKEILVVDWDSFYTYITKKQI